MDRITGCEIEFGMFDVTAKEDGVVTVSDKQPWSKPELQLKLEEQQIPAYMTGERNHNVLSGKMKLFPDNPAVHFFGWWSSVMSDSAGNFSVPLVLTVTFTEKHSSLGLTFRFEEATGDYCNRLNVKWYGKNNVLLADEDFIPDSAYFVARHKVNDYQKVIVTFYSTNRPRRYLKLTEIMYGALRIFGGKDLINAQVLEELDPISTQLSINTLNFQFHSSSGEFSLLDLRDMWSLLQWRQWFRVFTYLNREKIFLGTYYLDEPRSDTENTTTMNCIDLIGVIEVTDFKGGIYRDITADALLLEIMTSAGEPDGYQLEDSLKAVKVSGWLPICTHREALQQVAFAIGAVVDCSRSSKIRLRRMEQTVTGVIGYDQKIVGHTLKMITAVTGVEVTAHEYVTETEADKEQELQNGEMMAGEHEIKFGAPMHSLSVTGATISESNANYAKLRVTSAGVVVLKGKPYKDNTAVHGVYMQEMPAQQKPNVVQIVDATLISPSNAKEIAQRVYDYYQLRYQDEGEMIISQEHIGQYTQMASLNGQKVEGVIESLDIDLMNGYLGKVKLTGKAVNI